MMRREELYKATRAVLIPRMVEYSICTVLPATKVVFQKARRSNLHRWPVNTYLPSTDIAAVSTEVMFVLL